ncbi:MAG: ABC transporter permease subunit [bacterium]
MIRSLAHPATKAIHRAHTKHARHAWAIVGAIAVVAIGFGVFGYFANVDWATLAIALVRSTYRLALAYVIALALGAALGLLVGWSRFSDFLFPLFDVLQNVPSFALIPIFIYFFGFTDEMIILFAVSSIVWPILFSTLTAIRTVHADLNDAATIFGANGWRRICYYLAPLSFPAILTGSIVGIAIGWEAVIGAEIIADTTGFGAFIKTAGTEGISQTTVAGTLAILVLVFMLNRLIWAPLLAESSKHYSE